MKVAVSFLKSNYNLIETINKINNTNAEYIHVDIMDGIFVSNTTYQFDDLYNVLKNSNKLLDVHLMVDNPINYIIEYQKLNVDTITIHYEINHSIIDLINLIKGYKIKSGIAINPKTNIESIKKYLNLIDNVLIMSVEPGLGGQEFNKEIIPKIEELYKIRKENNLNFRISIDGGVNDKTIKYLNLIDVVVSGSFICCSNDFQKQIDILKKG